MVYKGYDFREFKTMHVFVNEVNINLVMKIIILIWKWQMMNKTIWQTISKNLKQRKPQNNSNLKKSQRM